MDERRAGHSTGVHRVEQLQQQVEPHRTGSARAHGEDGASELNPTGRLGDMYVTNSIGNSVTIYPTGANGNVAPTARIAGVDTGINKPTSLAVQP